MTTPEFFASLREKGSHLGLEPEFSSIELLATVEPEGRPNALRENIDLFFWGRSGQVLTQVHRWAAEQGLLETAHLLEQLRTSVKDLFSGQFPTYPTIVQLPQPGLLREMLRIAYDDGADVLDRYISDNLSDLNGSFYMSLSESLRNARERGEGPTFEYLLAIGRRVAARRVEQGLPCSCAGLYLR